MLLIGLAWIWFVSYIATQNAISLSKEHAIHGLGFTDEEVGLAIAISAGVAMPIVFGVGLLIDRIGRKPTPPSSTQSLRSARTSASRSRRAAR